MVNIRRYDTNIANVYTYFEFEELFQWEDFDILLTILTNQLNFGIKENYDGIWSRHCKLEKEGYFFELMYHEDFGNCLCSQFKKDEIFYKYLEKIANSVVAELRKIKWRN
ncbi:hypothetical protein [Bacillus sp. EAC]|uniref:hypothetical protein n=1 Tax=Bacillus sp. EAC TaxID=1978338 RepID=UPI000B442DC3|nr:hypothetical protein [Bacillus sp. EAC]